MAGLWRVGLQECGVDHCQSVALAVGQLAGDHEGVPAATLAAFVRKLRRLATVGAL